MSGLTFCVLTAIALGSQPAAAVNASVVPAMAVPLPMSRVELTGDWGDAQARNLDVLLSLNMSQWACHFTTAANLTSCDSETVVWNTYVKQKTGNYTHELGFLGQGPLAPSFCPVSFV